MSANVNNSTRLGIATMCRVIFALLIRETKTRYGRLKIGYLWAFLEPIFFVLILSVIFSYARNFSSAITMPHTQFFLTGILSFFLFQHIVIQSMTAITQNQQLLYYPQVQIIDLGLARMLLELATFFIVISILTFLIWFLELETVQIDDPLRMILAAFIIALFGYGLGTGIGALIPLFPSLQFLTQTVFLRPMFFISGIFFTAEMIPEQVQDLVLLNPVLNAVELMRSAYFVSYESEYVNYNYLIGIVTFTLFLGLLIQRAFRRYAFQT